jgi:glycine amidinotransferase/scyllo-inosamine-4-phosphate amidinotransferase 1
MKIFSNSEFMPLKSMVIGKADHAHWPVGDKFFDLMGSVSTWPDPLVPGPIDPKIIAEANEDLDKLAEMVDKFGARVVRPEVTDWGHTTRTHDHETTGMHSYSTRDLLLVIDDMVIECPTPTIARQHEFVAFDHVRREAIKQGCRWIAAPTPRMLEHDMTVVDGRVAISNDVPMFDAANVLKHGDKLLYLVSSSGNEAGADWLQSVVGSSKEVIKWKDVYAFSHIDSTLGIINEHTILANAQRVNRDNIPQFLRDFDVMWVEDMVPREFAGFPFSSKWIGMNVVMLDPETVVLDPIQVDLRDQFRSRGFRVMESALRHSRTLGGGHHCVTLDLEREKF